MFCEEWRAARRSARRRTRGPYRSRPIPAPACRPSSRRAREARSDAEMIDQPRLRPHHVGDGDDGKVEAVGLARCGIDLAGPGRAHAAADHVGADARSSGRCRSACRGRPWSPTSRACRSRDGCWRRAGRRSAHQTNTTFDFPAFRPHRSDRRWRTAQASPRNRAERLVRRKVHDLALRVGDLRKPQGMVGKGLRRRGLAHLHPSVQTPLAFALDASCLRRN